MYIYICILYNYHSLPAYSLDDISKTECKYHFSSSLFHVCISFLNVLRSKTVCTSLRSVLQNRRILDQKNVLCFLSRSTNQSGTINENILPFTRYIYEGEPFSLSL